MFEIGVYGTLVVAYIAIKMLLAAVYRHPGGQGCPSVDVVLPMFNEQPQLIRACLESILAQTYPIQRIFVVDDGSSSPDGWKVVSEFAARYPQIVAHRYPENRGKREAQAWGFARATADVIVTVDSDTILELDSVSKIVRPFSDPRMMATTGYPDVLNADVNLLTRLIQMRYWIAFNIERAAQSFFGSVICCCGVFSAYRRSMIQEVLEEYTSQRFLGLRCTYGDDRRLTALAIRRGKVTYVKGAVALTAAPVTLREYVKQQVRWMRSFWRESLLALHWALVRRPVVFVILAVELSLPFLLVFFSYGVVLYQLVFLGYLVGIVYYLAVVSVMAYIRNVAYSKRDIGTYLLSPIYGILYFTLLLPLCFYALGTLRTARWGTR